MPDIPLILNYPTSLDTTVSAGEVRNFATTTLSSSLGATDTVVLVASTSAFPNTGVILVDNEIISYTAKTSTQFGTVGSPVNRGVQSTTAVSHPSGTEVDATITRGHFEILRDAILALETKIGTGSSSIGSSNLFLKSSGAGVTGWSALTSGNVTTALGFTPQDVAQKGANNGYASLDSGGKVPSGQLPANVASFNGRTGLVTLSSSDVTTALTFTPQAALGFTPENVANKGATNGYASLDSSGKVPTSQLPASGTLTGAGTLNQVAFWSGTTSLSGNLALTFDGSTFITPKVHHTGHIWVGGRNTFDYHEQLGSGFIGINYSETIGDSVAHTSPVTTGVMSQVHFVGLTQNQAGGAENYALGGTIYVDSDSNSNFGKVVAGNFYASVANTAPSTNTSVIGVNSAVDYASTAPISGEVSGLKTTVSMLTGAGTPALFTGHSNTMVNAVTVTEGRNLSLTLTNTGTLTTHYFEKLRQSGSGSGTISTLRGISIGDLVSGTVADAIALDILAQSADGAGNRWQIYSHGTTGQHKLEGWLAIGQHLNFVGIASAPSVANSAEARMYFNSTDNKLYLSKNGGSYVDISAPILTYVSTFNTRSGAVTLTSGDVTTALTYTPENPANKGANSGYASLDVSGKVPSSQLPSSLLSGSGSQYNVAFWGASNAVTEHTGFNWDNSNSAINIPKSHVLGHILMGTRTTDSNAGTSGGWDWHEQGATAWIPMKLAEDISNPGNSNKNYNIHTILHLTAMASSQTKFSGSGQTENAAIAAEVYADSSCAGTVMNIIAGEFFTIQNNSSGLSSGAFACGVYSDVGTTTAGDVRGIIDIVNCAPPTGVTLATVLGQQMNVFVNDIGTVSLLRGHTNLMGTQAAATVTDLRGYTIATKAATGSTIGVAYGFYNAGLGYGNGAVTTSYGYMAKRQVGTLTGGNLFAGTVTNLYAFYSEDQSGLGSSNSYNFYSAGANSLNMFEGMIGLGKYVEVAEITQPSTPASGKGRLWYSSTDKKLHVLDSTGTDNPLGNPFGAIYSSATDPSTLVTGLGVGVGNFSGVWTNAAHTVQYFGVGGSAYFKNTTGTPNDCELYGGQFSARVDTANTGDLNNNTSGIAGAQAVWKIVSGATGTITRMCGMNVAMYPASSGATLTNAIGYQVQELIGTGPVTNAAAFSTSLLNYATNNTHLLMGTNTPASGNWSIYDVTGYPSLFGGLMTISPSSTSTKALVTKALASQTANLFEAQDSSAVSYVNIGPPVLDGGGTQSYFKVNATLPSTLTGSIQGIDFSITGAGSSSFGVTAQRTQLLAGYTGSSITTAYSAINFTAGTGNDFIAGAYNAALTGADRGTTTGDNIGILGSARDGNWSVGVVGRATVAKNSANNVGIFGFALNTGTSPVQVGGYFGLQTAKPTLTSAALMCDNGGTTSDIFVARDNGSAVFTIGDGGKVGIGNAPVSTAALKITGQFGLVRFDAGNSSTAITVDWSNGNHQKVTMTASSTFTLSNPIAGSIYVLEIVQSGAGSFTPTLPASVKWPSDVAPTWTTTSGKTDLITMYYNGTNYAAYFSLNYNI